MKYLKFLLSSVLFAVILIGCTNSSSSEPNEQKTKAPRDVTAKEAQQLSTVLSNNAKDINASFQMTSGVIGSTGFVAYGKVDWVDSTVDISVSLVDKKQVDIQTITTKEKVFETFNELASLADQANLEAKNWIVRDFTPSKFGIDVLSQFIAKLASPTPDNPILLKQNGAQFLGTQMLDGERVSLFQNTPNVTYFLTETGDLKKVSARINGFPNLVEIVFSRRSKSLITIPDIEDSFSPEEVLSFYPAQRPAF